MDEEKPIDFFSIKKTDEIVSLTFWTRYGEQEEYEFNVEDAKKIADGILLVLSATDEANPT